MASPEEKSYEIMRELDVNYVLVIFGGLTGYSSDGKISFWVKVYSFNIQILYESWLLKAFYKIYIVDPKI